MHKKISSLLNERLNDTIYTTFNELISNTNTESVCKLYQKLACTIMK